MGCLSRSIKETYKPNRKVALDKFANNKRQIIVERRTISLAEPLPAGLPAILKQLKGILWKRISILAILRELVKRFHCIRWTYCSTNKSLQLLYASF